MLTRRIVALLPITALLVTLGALVPGAAHAAVPGGTWQTPTDGATVSGTVALQFKTQTTNVTFDLPNGAEPATVSGGVATASWDTTKVANGTVSIDANECDQLTGCAKVTESVTVANPALSPLIINAQNGNVVSPGEGISITASNGGANEGTITDSLGYSSGAESFSTAYYTVPSGYASGTSDTITVTCTQNCASTSVTVIIQTPTTTPAPTQNTPVAPGIVAVSGARSFFPHRDGYLDSYKVTVTSDANATARLLIRKGQSVVSQGTTSITPYVVKTLTAGAGLKPGTYTWTVTLTGGNGMVTTSRTSTVIADPRKLVGRPASFIKSPIGVAGDDLSGSCGSAEPPSAKATTLVLKLKPGCKATNGAAVSAIANFFPGLKSAPAYGSITLSVTTSGSPAVLGVLQGGSTTVIAARVVKAGTTSIKLPGTVLSTQHHQLQFFLALTRGTATLTSIKVVYTYKTLAR